MKEGEVRHGVYLTHRAALIDYATPILGSREAAEDIVQDAFVRFVPERLRAVSGEQSLAYLYRIVRNLAFDVLKHRKVEAREEKRNLPHWALPRTESTPEQQVLFRETVRNVSVVLADMPSAVRIAVEMHRFGGYTLEEVADHLGISTATAHRYVRQAMLRIAETIEPRPL